MSPNTPTHKQCATRFSLWAEYVDPSGVYSEAEFEAMSVAEKIGLQLDAFGPERWSCARCGDTFEPGPDADPDDALCSDCREQRLDELVSAGADD